MKTSTALSTTLLTAFAVTLSACDAEAPRTSDRDEVTLAPAEIEAIYIAVDEVAEVELELDLDLEELGEVDAEVEGAADEARELDGAMSLAAPVNDARGCGWQYGVCMSWCLANDISNTCFSFCHAEFC